MSTGILYTKKVVLQVADSNNTRIAIIEDISTDKSLEQKFAPSEKRLESNSDLNDYKTQGSWWESSTATLVTTHYDHPSNQQMYLGSKSNNSWIRCQDICCLDGEVGGGLLEPMEMPNSKE